MLNVELPHGLKGAILIQHSTFNTQHSTLNIKKINENGKNDFKRISGEGNDNLPS